jgi:hypothetical protein
VTPLRVHLLVLGGLFLTLVTASVLGRWVLHGPVTAERLQRSVQVAAGALSSGSERCRRLRAARTWECDVSTDGGSSTVPYFVVVEPGSSCWHARVTARRYADDRAALRGCVHLWQWRVLD